MSQEVIIVRCFSCETFQTQIQKKAKKWECKMCGEKQSLKKTYGCGSGKDCRQHTQYLNEMRGKLHETEGFVEENVSTNYFNAAECSNSTTECNSTAHMKPSKWDQFMESKLKVTSDDSHDCVQQEVYRASDKLTTKVTQRKQFKNNENNVFELSDITYSNWKVSTGKEQCTENYTTSTIIKKRPVGLDRYKPTEYNLISNSCVNRETKSDYNRTQNKRNEKHDAFISINRETTSSVVSPNNTTGISVFDQNADFDSALDF